MFLAVLVPLSLVLYTAVLCTRMRNFKMFWDTFKKILKVGFLQKIWVSEETT